MSNNHNNNEYVQKFFDQMGRDTDEEIQAGNVTVRISYPDGITEEQKREIENYANVIKGEAESLGLDLITGYDWVKDKLILRPLNTKAFDPEQVIYESMGGGIALVLYAIVLDDREAGILNTIKIPKAIFDEWGIAKDVVMGRAMGNTKKAASPRVYGNIFDMEGASERETALLDEDFVNTFKQDATALMTTTRKTNGAIALFYDGVKEKLAEIYGGNYFVAFTSIHEAMIHKQGSIEPYSIKRNLTETNRIFGPDDTLTDSVFYYDAETKEFSPWEI